MKNYIKYITMIIVLVLWLFPCQAKELTIYQIEEQMNDALEDMDNFLQRTLTAYQNILWVKLYGLQLADQRRAQRLYSFTLQRSVIPSYSLVL